MILDCVTFHNEQRMWELRYATLRDVVDGFVVVEATMTHSGIPRRPVFVPPPDAPVVHWVTDLPDPETSSLAATRRRELSQRNAIRTAVLQAYPDLPDDAIVLVSDVDEIPRPGLVARIAAAGIPDGTILIFRQRLHYYDLTVWCPDQAWQGTRAARWADVRALTPHVVRYGLGNGDPYYPQWVVLDNGGWHLSYFGGVRAIQDKLAAFLHQELVTPAVADPDRIAGRIRAGKDLYDRMHGHTFLRAAPPDLPPPVQDHPDAWADLCGSEVVWPTPSA